MNRRDFLTIAVAAPAAAMLPAGASGEPGISLASLRTIATELNGYRQGPWLIFAHTDVLDDLRSAQARERWQWAQREWRADGKPTLSCREVLAKYTPADSLVFPRGEIGRYENVRFITS